MKRDPWREALLARVREVFPRAYWVEGEPVHYRPHPLCLECTELTEWLARFPANDSLRREDIARESASQHFMTDRAWAFYLPSYLARLLEDPSDMEFAAVETLSSMTRTGPLRELSVPQLSVLREFVTGAQELDQTIWDDEVAPALAAIDAELERRARGTDP